MNAITPTRQVDDACPNEPALNDPTPDGDTTKALIHKILQQIEKELRQIETDESFLEKSIDQRLKILTGLFKTIAAIDETRKRLESQQHDQHSRGLDPVEFRRELEEQIARLGKEDGSGKLPAATG